MVRHSTSYPILGHAQRHELIGSSLSRLTVDSTTTFGGQTLSSIGTTATLATDTTISRKRQLTSGLLSQELKSRSSSRGQSSARDSPSRPNSAISERFHAMMSSGNDRKAGPEPASTYYDKRLASLNIEFWTTVRVTSHYAASAISLYLETDHPVFGLFDAELFITDLIDCKFGYCSPFLVSSLLAFASVCSVVMPPL
jgi:hypothetical protein